MKKKYSHFLICSYITLLLVSFGLFAEEYQVIEGNNPPSRPTFLFPEEGNFSKLSIHCGGSIDPDNDTVYYEIEVLINGSWKKIAETPTGKVEWKPDNFIGNISLRCRATDLMNYSSWRNSQGEIFVDTIPPKIEVVSPPSNTIFPSTTKKIWINLTTNEKATCILVNYNKTFETKDGIHHYFLLENLKSGEYIMNYTCFDTLNNSNSVLQTFTISKPSAQQPSTPTGPSPIHVSPGIFTPQKKKKIEIEFNETIFRIVVYFKEKKRNPGLVLLCVSKPPFSPQKSQAIYRVYKIEKTNFENKDIENVTLEFFVEKTWIRKNNIQRIYVLRYSLTKEKYFPTKVKETEDKIYYQVFLPKLSYILIIGEKRITTPVTKVCEEGEKRCNDNRLEICRNGKWTLLKICEYGCNATTLSCISIPTPQKVCKEGEKRCYGDLLQICENNTWKTIEKCEYGCEKEKAVCRKVPQVPRKDKTVLVVSLGILIAILIIGLLLYKRKRRGKSETDRRKEELFERITIAKTRIYRLEERGENVSWIKEMIEKAEMYLNSDLLNLAEMYLNEVENELTFIERSP